MKLNKRHYIIFICCISLWAKPAWSLWPVFDFQEISPITSNIRTGLDSLNQAKSQMKELGNTLGSIGNTILTIAAYGQDLSKLNKAITGEVSSLTDTISNNLGNNQNIVAEIPGMLGNTQGLHQGLVGQFVDQTTSILKNKGRKLSQIQTKSEIKLALLENISIEEEEEEEEVSSTDTFKDEILTSFDSIKEENAQIFIQTNDVLDLAISNLNATAEINQKAFNNLKSALVQTDKLTEQHKNDLQKEVDALAKKEQTLSEWGIDIVESAKKNYNRQYKEKIEDGLNNYKKVIIAYLNGNVDRADVINVGNEFKLSAASINASPDISVIKKYQQETVIVQNETDKLKANIEKLLK